MKKTWWFSWSLAPFWLPLGSLLAPFGSLLAPFECQTSSKILFLFDLVSPFADVRNHFCKKVNVGTLSARTRIVGTPICGNPSLRPRAELCRRHLDKLYCSGFGAAFKNRRAKTPADIIKDNPQAPTETEIRVFPRHLTGHPYWTPFIPFYVDLYEDDWSSEPFKKSSGRKNRTPNRKVAPKTWILDLVAGTSVQFWFVPFKFKVGIFGFTVGFMFNGLSCF